MSAAMPGREAAMPKASAAPGEAELLARAEALIPVLRERAAKAESLRRVPDETVADLHAAGLFRMLQPSRVGGSELPFRALVTLTAAVARGCGSTAWVLTNMASHHWILAYWPREAQDEIWGDSPDHLVGSAFIFPCGRARRVPGGYRLSGRWPFSSGIDPATWTMFGALVEDEEEGRLPHRLFLLPASEYEVIDTWHAAGLKGTGSHDVAVADRFVPEHRTLAVEATRGGTPPGYAANPAPLYRLPLMSLFAFVVGATSLGIARGAVELFAGTMRSRASAYSGKSLAELGTLQLRLAEAAALVDSAELLVLEDCEAAMRIAAAGAVPSLEEKVRWRRDGAFAATQCTRAVDLVFGAAGGGGIYEKNPLQRAFRDIHAANAHYALSWDVNGTMYGRVALGLSADAPTL